MPTLLSRNELLVIALKYYAETEIKGFWFCPILLDFFTLYSLRFIGFFN